MADLDPIDANGESGAPAESQTADATAELEATPELQVALETPRKRRSHRALRNVLNLLGGLMLMLIILSGSVYAAHELAGSGSAPDTSVHSLQVIANVVQQAGVNPTATPANCSNCSPSHHSVNKGPTAADELVVVSLSKQQLWAYQAGKLVMTSLVTTGMPQLPTPTGTFHVFLKETNVMFYSPWPVGSPFYYTPEHINYAMEFLGGGYYIHDAPWRHAFGPGTNVPHTDPDGTVETGSHGCVNMPTSAAAQLYAWLLNGATVTIQP